MVETFETSKSFCRVCMDTLSAHIEFGVFFKSDNDLLTYMDCFEYVTRIKIDLHSSPRQNLCNECADELKSAFTFIRKAELAEKRLQESIDSVSLDKLVEKDLFDLIDDNKSLNELSSIEAPESELDNLSVYAELELETHNNEAEVDTTPLNGTIAEESQHKELDECFPEDYVTLENVPTAEEDFFCMECKKNFKNERSLYQHQKRFHPVKNKRKGLENTFKKGSLTEYNCEECMKTFKSLSLLKTHQRYHERKKFFKKSEACPVCNKQFTTAFYLRQHTELVHAAERPQLSCDQCEKKYMTKNALEKHKRIHTGKTVECHECGKSFVNLYELKIHLRFHTRNYPFQCKLCERKFAIKGHLRTHMWQHKGLKLQCENCEKLFTSTKALLEHSYSHSEKMPFPCCYCNKSYPSKQKYKAHLKTVHLLGLDEVERITSTSTSELTVRKKNLKLVHADSAMKDIEMESDGSDET